MTEPTDAELIAELEAAGVLFMAFRGGVSGTKELWMTSGSQDAKKIAAGMRAAIAEWGTPPAVAGEPDYATFAIWYAHHIGDENKPVRDAALATYEAFAPPQQPTQAQAGAVPLTPAQVVEASCVYWGKTQLRNAFEAGARFAEQHHGIKGGQHGL